MQRKSQSRRKTLFIAHNDEEDGGLRRIEPSPSGNLRGTAGMTDSEVSPLGEAAQQQEREPGSPSGA